MFLVSMDSLLHATSVHSAVSAGTSCPVNWLGRNLEQHKSASVSCLLGDGNGLEDRHVADSGGLMSQRLRIHVN